MTREAGSAWTEGMDGARNIDPNDWPRFANTSGWSLHTIDGQMYGVGWQR